MQILGKCIDWKLSIYVYILIRLREISCVKNTEIANMKLVGCVQRTATTSKKPKISKIVPQWSESEYWKKYVNVFESWRLIEMWSDSHNATVFGRSCMRRN